MPEPLKNLYSKKFITKLCNEIVCFYSDFDSHAFSRSVFDKNWKNRELKQRMRHITQCLHLHLPADYKIALNILRPVAENFNGFESMIFQDYVECYGLEDFANSISALEHFTKYASSEFAIRVFILLDEKRTMKQMLRWSRSKNHHVRRLASEGCRPRLPWAISLPAFKQDPSPIFPVLKNLMFDKSEYVRRSVANNLNDISKDHPDIVLDWAEQWLDRENDTDRLIKHACRTLLKQGDKKALSLFGFTEARHISIKHFDVQQEVKLGDNLQFSFSLSSQGDRLGNCRIEFAIDFLKANNKHFRKVFKISESNYAEVEKQINKYFSFKEISTRRYYQGEHRLTIILNGQDRLVKNFNLLF